MVKSEHLSFPLGESTKWRRVKGKPREESSSSEDSEAGDNDTDEENENDHGQDLDKKTNEKYGKGMNFFS